MEEFMLPCLNKKIFGIDCLGCGMQRATAFLFQGEFIAAYKMYPAIYTLILLLGFIIFNMFLKFKFDSIIRLTLIAINVIIILVSYIIKISVYF
jgi:hypothetical protein